MKLMNCPLNGPRNITEFICRGAVRPEPEGDAVTDKVWAEHIWFSDNTAGVVREWWCHVPTNHWFIAERNTLTDEVGRTYVPSNLPPSARIDR